MALFFASAGFFAITAGGLPQGTGRKWRGAAVGREVELDIDLLLMREDPAATHEGS